MKNGKHIRFAVQKGNTFIPKEYNWKYCVSQGIPYILVHIKIKFASVAYDLFSIDPGLRFPEDHRFYNRWLVFYDKYRTDTNLPDNQYSFIGGTRNGIFKIWKKDYQEVVAELISQIDDHVRLYGKIDPVQKEYHEKMTRMNEMMNKSDKSINYDNKEYQKLLLKTNELLQKMKGGDETTN